MKNSTKDLVFGSHPIDDYPLFNSYIKMNTNIIDDLQILI